MNNAVLENIRIPGGSYRNFSGRETQFNAKGSRNFIVFLDENVGEKMESDGWPIRWKEDRHGEGDRLAQLKVNLKYTARDGRKMQPPKIVVISSNGRVNYDESMVDLIDTMEIEKCDMILRPYEYSSPQGKGVSAYLKTMYITLSEDELDLKYREQIDDDNSNQKPLDDEDTPW